MTNINIRTLKAVFTCAGSNEETRYYLKGVFVELRPGVTRYTATDGHVLVTREERNELESSGAWIIPGEECKAWKLHRTDLGEATITAEADGYLRIARPDGTARLFRPVDGTFPDYVRVIPSSASNVPAQFDGELLARFEKFSGEMGLAKPVICYNGDGPAPVTFEGEENTLAVIMPMRKIRGNAPEYQLPAFLAPVKQAAAA